MVVKKKNSFSEYLVTPIPRTTMCEPLGEKALSIVCGVCTNKAIDERDALQLRVAELEREIQYLRGNYGPDDGNFVIATYRFEQRFKIPEEATWWQVKWGMLRYMTPDGEEKQMNAFYGVDFEDMSERYKRPDAVRCTVEDEDGLYNQYEEYRAILESNDESVLLYLDGPFLI